MARMAGHGSWGQTPMHERPAGALRGLPRTGLIVESLTRQPAVMTKTANLAGLKRAHRIMPRARSEC